MINASTPSFNTTRPIREEADLKYRALKMVLPSDDPNVRYIEKNFSVKLDGEALLYKGRNTVGEVDEDWQKLEISDNVISATIDSVYEMS